MSAEPQKLTDQFKEFVRAPRSSLILVRGASSLEPLAERLQPQRRRTEDNVSKRHWLWPRRRTRPDRDVTARYALAAGPLVPLLIDAYVTDLERLDHGQDPVGELRFGSRKRRRDYLNRTADMAVPDPEAGGSAEMMLPLVPQMLPEEEDARLVFLVELEPGTSASIEWSALRELVPSELPKRAVLAVADPDSELLAETDRENGVLFLDASSEPEFQRPKRGDRPVRAGLGIEPQRPTEPEPPATPSVSDRTAKAGA